MRHRVKLAASSGSQARLWFCRMFWVFPSVQSLLLSFFRVYLPEGRLLNLGGTIPQEPEYWGPAGDCLLACERDVSLFLCLTSQLKGLRSMRDRLQKENEEQRTVMARLADENRRIVAEASELQDRLATSTEREADLLRDLGSLSSRIRHLTDRAISLFPAQGRTGSDSVVREISQMQKGATFEKCHLVKKKTTMKFIRVRTKMLLLHSESYHTGFPSFWCVCTRSRIVALADEFMVTRGALRLSPLRLYNQVASSISRDGQSVLKQENDLWQAASVHVLFLSIMACPSVPLAVHLLLSSSASVCYPQLNKALQIVWTADQLGPKGRKVAKAINLSVRTEAAARVIFPACPLNGGLCASVTSRACRAQCIIRDRDTTDLRKTVAVVDVCKGICRSCA